MTGKDNINISIQLNHKYLVKIFKIHKDENKKNKQKKWDQCKWEIEKFSELLHSLNNLIEKKEGDNKGNKSYNM